MTTKVVINQPIYGGEESYGKELFTCLRNTFNVSNQTERAVFWLERVFNRHVLRMVKNLNRRKKSDDVMINFVNDVDSAKIAIGKYASGCNLTNVCWELYNDFSLSSLNSSGRFDLTDLLASETSRAITECENPMDWDFDSIIRTHQCHKCMKLTYNTSSVLYLSHEKCAHCNESPTFDQNRSVILNLIETYRKTQEKIVTHSKMSTSSIQNFINPLTNSVIYWWITEIRIVNFNHKNTDVPDLYKPQLTHIFNNSLFKLMIAPNIRKYLLEYLEGINEKDWEFLVAQLSIYGDLINNNQLGKETHKNLLLSSQYIEKAMPLLINNIILNHKSQEH